jgi:glycosyltransferase involved in cell wall biosynthesis
METGIHEKIMKNSKKITLTIGIPTYNEGKNIGLLLQSINIQEFENAQIVKIIVYSDASTDDTLDVLNKAELKDIEVIAAKKRMGKSYAMNQIIKRTKSDILAILDADILVRDKNMIEKLIEPIIKQSADLTSARVKEYWTKSKFEQILKVSMLLKKDIFESVNKGNNIYTCHGRARAMSKKLYKAIRFKNNMVAEDAYAYLFAIYNKFSYIFAKDANVHYRLPGTFKDHQKQSVRFIQSYKQLANEFGAKFINKEKKLPKAVVIPFVFKYFLKYPLTLILYALILFYMRVRSILVNEIKAKWDIAKSTKGEFSK